MVLMAAMADWVKEQEVEQLLGPELEDWPRSEPEPLDPVDYQPSPLFLDFYAFYFRENFNTTEAKSM